MKIGYFISPHGYGHATRAAAVLEALARKLPPVKPLLFTTVAQDIFLESLTGFEYHRTRVDLGLVQSSALTADLDLTCGQLDSFLPYNLQILEKTAEQCRSCSLIVCDIAPLGIVVAQRLGIPSVLIENFTWDWIYAPYLTAYPRLVPHARYFQALFAQATIHIQSEPLCAKSECDLHCGPIFRVTRTNSEVLRRQMGWIDRPVVLISMGGVAQELHFLEKLQERQDLLFIITGVDHPRHVGGNIVQLSKGNSIFHPDLINAADLVVCKAGYSTIAECYQAGSRVISVGRDDFAETAPLQAFLQESLGALCIDTNNFLSGNWLNLADQLLALPKSAPASQNGADSVAGFLVRILQETNS